MATIGSLLSSNVTNNSYVNSIKDEMTELKSKSKEMDSKEYGEKMSELQLQLSEAKASSVSVNSAAVEGITDMFSYMNGSSSDSGSLWGEGIFGDSELYGSKGTLTYMKTLNSARIGIENRARVLASEISFDRAKGYDVSSKQESLSNLTDNLEILNNNLNASIEKALSEPQKDSNFVNVVDKLRESLATASTEEETEEQGGVEQTDTSTSSASTGSLDDVKVEEENIEKEAVTNQAEETAVQESPERAVEMGVTPVNV